MLFKTVSLLSALLCIANAKPSLDFMPYAEVDIDLAIISGTDAQRGAWPWQLSQQVLRPNGLFGHTCGASLLSSKYALSAAHCVERQPPSAYRIVAGVHDRSDYTDTQTTNVASYKMHENYEDGTATYSNDIAIITFETEIIIGGNVQIATLPADNSNDFAGQNCVITGWGLYSVYESPNILQQADITPISLADCQSRSGTGIWGKHICLHDSSNTRGACSGDSGGPVSCPSGDGYVVVGVASFVSAVRVPNNGVICFPSQPSVYTRTSAYLDWITANTP